MTLPSSDDVNELDLSDHVHKVGEHYEAIGEYADLWLGELTTQSGAKPRVAIKVLRGGSMGRPSFSDKLNKDLQGHGLVWRQFHHPNIANFLGLAFNCGAMPALILEYYPKGNIIDFSKKNSASNETKLRLIKEIALGIKYLHEFSPPVIHGDIRGANVLIDAGGHAVLADYGLAFIIESSEFTSVKTAGTCRWTAPEVMGSSEDDDSADSRPLFTLSSDIFAYAMTIIEVFTEQMPFASKKNDSSVIFAVLDRKRPEIPEYLQENKIVADLLGRCWDHSPSKRPSAAEVCEILSFPNTKHLVPLWTGIRFSPSTYAHWILQWSKRFFAQLWPF